MALASCIHITLTTKKFSRYLHIRDSFEIKQVEDNELNPVNIFKDVYKINKSKHLISNSYKRIQNSKNYSYQKEMGERIQPWDSLNLYEGCLKDFCDQTKCILLFQIKMCWVYFLPDFSSKSLGLSVIMPGLGRINHLQWPRNSCQLVISNLIPTCSDVMQT